MCFYHVVSTVHRNKEDISRERLSETNLIVFGGSREEFASSETADLTRWLNEGGRVLYLASDTFDINEAPNNKSFLGKYVLSRHNLMFTICSYGIELNRDSVMRSVYYKYLHPKEVYIAEGLLVPDMGRKKNDSLLSGSRRGQSNKPSKVSKANKEVEKLPFVFPYGVSLNVSRPSRPLLSSGPISYPMNRPIAAVWESETVAEVGSQRQHD